MVGRGGGRRGSEVWEREGRPVAVSALLIGGLQYAAIGPDPARTIVCSAILLSLQIQRASAYVKGGAVSPGVSPDVSPRGSPIPTRPLLWV